MDGEALGRRSLVLDSAYCAVTGSVLIGKRRSLAQGLGLPPRLVGAAGLGTLAWSGLVASMVQSDGWRSGARRVAVANSVAAVALLVAAVRHGHPRTRLLLASVGADVAAFAVAQAAAVRHESAQFGGTVRGDTAP